MQLGASTHLVVVLGLMVLVAAAEEGQNDCTGNVGDYEYDLTQLAQRIGGVDLQTTDPAGNTYYYRVCGVVGDNFCQTVDGLMPAVCQKDASIPPAYHGCGDQSTAWFGRLPGGNEYDGFALHFTGGAEGRATNIYYQWYGIILCFTHYYSTVVGGGV
jgi:hypothetical protein